MIRRTITLPDEMDVQIQQAAEKKCVSYSAYIRQVAEQSLEQEQGHDPFFDFQFDGSPDLASNVNVAYLVWPSMKT